MKIGLIGAGRLGICLALLIEQAGYDVIASDVREDYVKVFKKRRLILVNLVFKNYLRNQQGYNSQLITVELL